MNGGFLARNKFGQRLVKDRAVFRIEDSPVFDQSHHFLKPRIGILDQRRGASEVCRERTGQRAMLFKPAAKFLIRRNVRAAETVDGLFGVADDGDGAVARLAAGFFADQEPDDIGLNRIRVLELIDKDVAEQSGVERPMRLLTQNISKFEKQIQLVNDFMLAFDLLVNAAYRRNQPDESAAHPPRYGIGNRGGGGIAQTLRQLPAFLFIRKIPFLLQVGEIESLQLSDSF